MTCVRDNVLERSGGSVFRFQEMDGRVFDDGKDTQNKHLKAQD